ncbi:hypothetical protein TNCT_471461 [Trichonephila clavata]|uniref:Uncharacterized protein n=1 Tax=Trichonephila clavata TaxID=2740835 RepID=A0A8X6HDB5_TRICU|nr:hypothetical protein TNCT_471441 [Trichonephila clavata]GFR21593.1 hypothetical protein TNCT_471461 [Trichonephila clavata]
MKLVVILKRDLVTKETIMKTPSTGPESEPINTSELKSEPIRNEKEMVRFHIERLQIDQLRLSGSKKKITKSLLSSFRIFRRGKT